MGIGSTTAASAIVAAFTGLPVAEVTGRGTGIDDATWTHKVHVIERALATNRPDPADPLDVLSKVGGLEIAALVGVVLGAAARRIPIIVDGFIATAAALVAVELCPLARGYLIAAHRSVEVGHRAALERLELEPLFALDLRLGEGPVPRWRCRCCSQHSLFLTKWPPSTRLASPVQFSKPVRPSSKVPTAENAPAFRLSRSAVR